VVNRSADRPDGLAAKVAAALDRLARARRLERQSTATRHGLTPLQLDLLTTLADGPPPEPTVGLLATEVAVTQPTATDSLRALADKALVERRPDPADRRRSTIELTAAGRRLARELSLGDDHLTAAIAALPTAVQEATLEALLSLIARLVDTGAIDVARTCYTCRYHRFDGTTHHCALLETDLPTAELRVNCPDHEAA
jgi:DNA-binding MarR family transcriptional regulator